MQISVHQYSNVCITALFGNSPLSHTYAHSLCLSLPYSHTHTHTKASTHTLTFCISNSESIILVTHETKSAKAKKRLLRNLIQSPIWLQIKSKHARNKPFKFAWARFSSKKRIEQGFENIIYVFMMTEKLCMVLTTIWLRLTNKIQHCPQKCVFVFVCGGVGEES